MKKRDRETNPGVQNVLFCAEPDSERGGGGEREEGEETRIKRDDDDDDDTLLNARST